MKVNKIINLMLAFSLVLTMVACNGAPVSETTKAPETTTAPETNAPETTAPETNAPETNAPGTDAPGTQAPETAPEFPIIDYSSLDLEQYVILGQYKDINIEIEKKTVVDEEYALETIKKDMIRYGFTKEITDRAVTKDDTVKISYKGLLNGVAFEGGTGDKDDFTIYDGGGFIPGFAEGLIGAMPGVEVDVNLSFPDNYHSADLAGKAVVFKVTVHHIYEAADLTDELVSEMTRDDYKTVSAFVNYYMEYLTNKINEEYEEKKGPLVWETINKNATLLKSPDDIIDKLYNYEIWYVEEQAKYYGMDADTLLAYQGYTRDTLREAISETVINNIVTYSIIKAEGLTLSKEEYEQFLTDEGVTEETLLETYTKEHIENLVLAVLTYDKVIEWQNFIEIEPETEGK